MLTYKTINKYHPWKTKANQPTTIKFSNSNPTKSETATKIKAKKRRKRKFKSISQRKKGKVRILNKKE